MSTVTRTSSRSSRWAARLRARSTMTSVAAFTADGGYSWTQVELSMKYTGPLITNAGIVETVIHEITHSTFFPKGQARFNESFANFVGHRGAISFFCDGIADEASCETAEDRWHDIRDWPPGTRPVYAIAVFC